MEKNTLFSRLSLNKKCDIVSSCDAYYNLFRTLPLWRTGTGETKRHKKIKKQRDGDRERKREINIETERDRERVRERALNKGES